MTRSEDNNDWSGLMKIPAVPATNLRFETTVGREAKEMAFAAEHALMTDQ